MTNQTDILIVGAGPAGLLAAIIASQLGLRYEIIERRPTLHPEPSAHVFKTHTMEVYRRVGVADRIFAQSTHEDLQRCIVWCESLKGLCYGKLDLGGKKGLTPRFTRISTVYSANVPQNVVEPLLHARLQEVASMDPVRFDTRLTDLAQDAEGVTAQVEENGTTREIRASYVLGADGAGSRVRRSAGIAMEGPPALAHFLAIHIRSDAMPILERHPGVVFFVRAPDLSGFFIMHQPVGSQVFMLRIDPEVTPRESFTEDRCRKIIDRVIGGDHDYEISSVDDWVMSAQIAERYREGRILLLGDAGHRFPPTGGLGLNTGVEDVENLMWKLAAVIRGKAAGSLLDSYEQECRPIAIRNTQQSVKNNERMQIVETALGAEGGDDALAAVIAELSGDPDHPRFESLRAAVDDQIDHFAYLELEMAAHLPAGLFIPAQRQIAKPFEPVEGYQPSFEPGNHIPHFWIDDACAAIDVLRFDCFTLFVPSGAEDDWQQAIAELGDAFLPIETVAIEASMRSELGRVGDYWGGTPFAILVRPDGRIGWVEPEILNDRADALRDAMARLSARQMEMV